MNKFLIGNLYIRNIITVLAFLITFKPPSVSCEMCSETHSLMRPEYKGLEPSSSYDGTTQYDYMCQEVKQYAYPCTFETDLDDGSAIGASDWGWDYDWCRDRVEGNIHRVNCVKCDTKCHCKEHEYLHFIRPGTCWPTELTIEKTIDDGKTESILEDAISSVFSFDALEDARQEEPPVITTYYHTWDNIDPCQNRHHKECGYICRQCPSGKYRFNPENGGSQKADCEDLDNCCFRPTPGDLFYEETMQQERAEQIKNQYRKDVEEFEDLIDGIQESEMFNAGWDDYALYVLENNYIRNITREAMEKYSDRLGTSGKVCGYSVGDVEICNEAGSYSIDPCLTSENSATMTVSFLPYRDVLLNSKGELEAIYYPLRCYDSNSEFCSFVRTPGMCLGCREFDDIYSLIEGVDGSDISSGSSRPRGGSEGLTCLAHQFQSRDVSDYCTNCDLIGYWDHLLESREAVQVTSIGDRTMTFKSECQPYEAAAAERGAVATAETAMIAGTVGAAVLCVAGAVFSFGASCVAAAALVGTAVGTASARGDYHDRQDLLKFRCNNFQLNNPNHVPITIKCGTEAPYPQFRGEDLKCLEFSNNITAEYLQVPDPDITKKKIFIGGNRVETIPITLGFQDNNKLLPVTALRGLKSECELNEGSFSIGVCELLKDNCYSLHEIYNTLVSEYNFNYNYTLGYYDNYRTVDAAIRRAFNVVLPKLPTGSKLLTYKTSDCSGFASRGKRLSTADTSIKSTVTAIGIQHATTNSEGKTIHQKIQEAWQASEVNKYYDIYDSKKIPIVKEGGIPHRALQDILTDKFMADFENDNDKSFKVIIDSQWVCDCGELEEVNTDIFTESEGGNENGNENRFYYDILGLHQCKPCAMSMYNNGGTMVVAEERHRSILRDLSEAAFSKKICGRSFRKCVECGYKTFPNSDRTSCIQCTGYKVPTYYEGEWSCVECDAKSEYYVYAGVENREFPTCEPIPIVSLSYDFDSGYTAILIHNFETGDMFKDDVDNPTHLRPIRDGFYLDMETRTERRCEKPSIAATYLKKCGLKGTYFLMSGNIQLEIFKGDCVSITGGTCTYELRHDAEEGDLSQLRDWQYMRGGIVTPCATCGQNQYMNVPCSSEGAGFAGSCKYCMWCYNSNPWTESGVSEPGGATDAAIDGGCHLFWLYHEEPMGCNPFRAPEHGEVMPTKDYVKRDCRKFIESEDTVNIALGCGEQNNASPYADKIWNCDTDGNDYGLCNNWMDGTTDFKLGSEFLYDAPLVQLIGSSGAQWSIEWSPYREYSTLAPYCPKFHYLEKIGTEGHYEALGTYDGSKCKLCRPVCTLSLTSDMNSGQVRGNSQCKVEGVAGDGGELEIPDCIENRNDRRICPGNTYEDTQDKCQDGCDLNYYRDVETSTCRPCELCEF